MYVLKDSSQMNHQWVHQFNLISKIDLMSDSLKEAANHENEILIQLSLKKDDNKFNEITKWNYKYDFKSKKFIYLF
jgi:hypothetical protein